MVSHKPSAVGKLDLACCDAVGSVAACTQRYGNPYVDLADALGAISRQIQLTKNRASTTKSRCCRVSRPFRRFRQTAFNCDVIHDFVSRAWSIANARSSIVAFGAWAQFGRCAVEHPVLSHKPCAVEFHHPAS